MFAVATDSSLNTDEKVSKHKQLQSAAIAQNEPRMIYEGGRQAIRLLAQQISTTSNQLYVQLVLQTQLLGTLIDSAILYYVQRLPSTLSRFKLVIDGKSPKGQTDYESAFEKIAPGLLQTQSIKHPLPMLLGADYRAMERFIHKPGTIPEYLVKEFPFLASEGAIDIQKIIREDITFGRSEKYDGLQIADLLASGLRRALRLGFLKNEAIFEAIGQLMVQAAGERLPLRLMSLGSEAALSEQLSNHVRLLTKHSRPMMNGGPSSSSGGHHRLRSRRPLG